MALLFQIAMVKVKNGIWPFAFNYSALISCGISASALSGLKYAIPKLVSEVANQLFIDNRHENLTNFFDYNEPEFIGSWSKDDNQVKTI